MKIGIDVDGVLIDFEERLKCQAEIFDIIEINNNRPKDENCYWVQLRNKWTENEWDVFSRKYLLKLTEESEINHGAKQILDLLKQDGNEFIVISARGTFLEEMITLVEEKIKNNNINIDKYYWKQVDKLEVCQNEKVDIMIDDNPNTCEKLSKNGIKTLYFRNIYGKELEKNEYLKEVHNWGEVYRYIKDDIND